MNEQFIDLSEYEQSLDKAFQRKAEKEKIKKEKTTERTTKEAEFFNNSVSFVGENIKKLLEPRDFLVKNSNDTRYGGYFKIQVTSKKEHNFNFDFFIRCREEGYRSVACYFASKNHTASGKEHNLGNSLDSEAIKKELLDTFFNSFSTYLSTGM